MVEAEDLQCLKAIALKGGCREPVFISSNMLGNVLATSPQTASRRLKALETGGHLTRSIRPDGQFITITRKGEDELKKEYAEYSRIFEHHGGRYLLTGTVVSGLGEGKYYMSREPYRKQFQEHMGFVPFPGTFNVRLVSGSIPVRKKIDALNWVTIKGFTADGRTFGDVKGLACRIGDVPAAIVVPGRTHYPDDTLELISPVALRERLGAKDSDPVTVEVEYD